MESLRTVYKQFKQGLVLITEAIKYPLDHPNETTNHIENKLKYLVNQINVLIKWVMSYDPAGFNPAAVNDHKINSGDFLDDLEEKHL
jgi:hypothetical protein